ATSTHNNVLVGNREVHGRSIAPAVFFVTSLHAVHGSFFQSGILNVLCCSSVREDVQCSFVSYLEKSCAYKMYNLSGSSQTQDWCQRRILLRLRKVSKEVIAHSQNS